MHVETQKLFFYWGSYVRRCTWGPLSGNLLHYYREGVYKMTHRKSESRNEEKNGSSIIFSKFLDPAVPVANDLWTSHFCEPINFDSDLSQILDSVTYNQKKF